MNKNERTECDSLMDDVYDILSGNDWSVGTDFTNPKEVSEMFLSFDATEPMIFFTMAHSGKKYALMLTEVCE